MTLLDAPQPVTSARLFADDLARHGDRPALITADGVVSYAELDRRVAALAARLGHRRLVAVEAANTIDAVVAYLAALRGGHAVLLLPQVEATALRLLEAYDADVVLSADSAWEPDERRIGSARVLHPELALLLPTSGSTGSSKLVRLSRENLQANAAAIADYLCITTDDRAATTLPMQYCYGLSVMNSHLAVGAGLVLTDLSVVDACFWDLFRKAGATSFAGVPYTFELLDRIGFESMPLPGLRYVTQAGGRLHPDQVRRYADMGRERGWQLYVMYGQTEATARMAYLPPAFAAAHPTAIGVPVPGGSFRIEPLDQTGDGSGELVYRGPNVMLGYARTPVDLSLGRTVDELRTGDIARRNADGLYEIVGRYSRFIKPYGIRVDLDQLELAIAARGVASFCAGDDETLDVAVEVDVDTADVLAEVRQVAAVPASRVRITRFDVLPRLASGKPDYITVRQQAAAQTPSNPLPPPRSELSALFAEILGHEVTDDESFVSAGGDSLSYVELSIALEERLGSLPRDWHVLPIRELAPKRGGRRLFRAVETSVAVRALAIVLIVGTHVGLWHLPGGAHVLLGVAGYNFARFQLVGGGIGRSIARIAVPSACWIGAVALMSDKYGWPNALLVNGLVGRPGDEWGYWFIEALVYILIPTAALLAIPSVRRVERRWPFAAALAAVMAGLAVRFDIIDLTSMQYRTSRPHEVFWLFALGWAAAVASTGPRRVLVSALIVASVPGFFGNLHREALIVAGLLLVLWAPTLRLPAALTRVAGTLAAASLYIYLTHWQVFPLVLRHLGRPAAVAAGLAAGIGAFVVAGAITTRLSALAASMIRLDAGKDHLIMRGEIVKRLTLSICAGLFLVLVSCGDDEPDVVDEPAAQSEGDDEFEVLDANDDDFLDVNEIPESEGRETFLAWDTDRNASLDRDEIHGTAFQLWDIDRNGRISEDEWTQNADVWYSRPVVEAFADWDNDGDSELDADEFSERFDLSAVGERWTGETLEEDAFKDAYFELYDADNDGRVSRLEWQSGKAIWGTPPE